jgi:predicted ATPase
MVSKMALRTISLTNFKQFEKFTVHCRNMNVLVGPNNAGKSTTLDALRICSDVLKVISRRTPRMVSQEGDGVCPTYQIEHSSVSLSLSNIVRNYGDEDAEIHLVHENKNELVIRLSPDRAIMAFLRTQGQIPRTIAAVQRCFPLNIVVVPTLGPFEEQENYLSDDTVRKNENTRLAHRNFRNIWIRRKDSDFNELSNLVREAWGNTEISKPQIVRGVTSLIEMFYSEDRKPREIYWSGFGFQVWLQMMTHILRGRAEDLLVLDEPDIYLHPDLQRRLVKIVERRFGQVFIATHSIEIINEVNTGDVLSVSRKNKTARRITTDDQYSDLFRYIGSSENIEFARLAKAKRVIFFEGQDRKIMRRFVQKTMIESVLEDSDTVFLQAGGFGQWKRVKEVGWTLEQVFGISVKVYSIFDRDYRCDEEISSFVGDMNTDATRCYVLGRKEIENYVLDKTLMYRVASRRAKEVGRDLSESSFFDICSEVENSLKEDIRSQITSHFLSYRRKASRSINDSVIIRESNIYFDSKWKCDADRLKMVPGKEYLSLLTTHLQSRYGISTSVVNLVGEMRVSEVPKEITEILRDMQNFFCHN